MNKQIQRARLLMQNRRWDMAISELSLALTEDHVNPEAHGLLAYCFLQQEKYDQAEEEARAAIGNAPDNPLGFQTLAIVLLERRNYRMAAEAVGRAITLDPFDAENFAIQGRVESQLENWSKVLQAAESGLQIDPEHSVCNNLRAMALVKLGRRSEAGQTLDATLARNPEDSFTHANKGWAMLESGQREQAFEHFRESLAQNPEMEWSRAGIVEAMKARSPLYRMLLSFTLFMLRMPPRVRWGILIGGYILQNLLAGFSRANPQFAAYTLPVILAYGAFALFTWLGYPLFNLILFTDKFGRRVLSRDQKFGAVLVGSLILIPLLMLIGFAIFDRSEFQKLGIWSSINLALVAIPASVLFSCDSGWPRISMAAVVVALLILALIPLSIWGAIMVWQTALEADVARYLLNLNSKLFLPGLVGSQFLGIYLAQVTPRR